MPRKRHRKKRFRRRRKRFNTTLTNRFVDPLPDNFVTTLEFNDMLTAPGAATTYYSIYRTNGGHQPYHAGTFTGPSADSPYGWLAFEQLYRRYRVLSSSIHCQIVNVSDLVPIVASLVEEPIGTAIGDQDDILGDPRAKNVLVTKNVNVGKLSRFSCPFKAIGIGQDDDTYQALTTANPAAARFYQINLKAADGVTVITGYVRVRIRMKVKFMDRASLTQDT